MQRLPGFAEFRSERDALAEFARAGLREPELVRLDADAKLSPDLSLAFFTTRAEDKPAALLHLLRDGNDRFRAGRVTKKYYMDQVDATATGQHPMAVVVNCIDSRTSPEICCYSRGPGHSMNMPMPCTNSGN